MFNVNSRVGGNKVTGRQDYGEKYPVERYVGQFKTVLASELSKLYKPYNANRGQGMDSIDMARVRQIAKSIVGTKDIPGVYKGTAWLIEPIIVNARTKMVVDGHYTWAALEEVLKKEGVDWPVLVIERDFPKEYTNAQIVSMFNTCRKPWASYDYVECYVKEGLPDYIKLKQAALKLGGPFVKLNGKPNYKYVVALMSGNDYSKLRKGEFKYDSVVEERGERVKQLFYRVSKTRQTSNWFEQFIKAYSEAENILGDKAFSRLMAHADEIVMDGSTDTKSWTEQFQKFL